MTAPLSDELAGEGDDARGQVDGFAAALERALTDIAEGTAPASPPPPPGPLAVWRRLRGRGRQ